MPYLATIMILMNMSIEKIVENVHRYYKVYTNMSYYIINYVLYNI